VVHIKVAERSRSNRITPLNHLPVVLPFWKEVGGGAEATGI
jgi:hypothetical protein